MVDNHELLKKPKFCIFFATFYQQYSLEIRIFNK